VLTTPALTEVWHDLAPKFEATGHKLIPVYAPSGAITKRATEGEIHDVLFTTTAGVETLTKNGKLIAGTGTLIASSGMGVAVLKGAPKPDISTPEKFKQALLAAKAVAYTDPAAGGASGAHMAKVLERLGITKEINARAAAG
jgi:molybdate transport system substrate-binding protein